MTPSPSATRARPATARLVGGLLCGLVATGLLASCAGGGSQDSAAGTSEVRAADSAAAPAEMRDDAGSVAGAVEPEQQMITTGTVEVVVDDPAAAAREIADLVEQAGGRTEQREEQVRTDTSEPRADLTVRVPADSVTPTIAALGEIGTVEATRISSTDVGNQATDLDARIKALQTSATRLETLMSTAATTADLLDAETTLTSRQADLESLQAQRVALADQVEMSTLVIALTTEPIEAQDEDPGFWSGLATGWDALVTTALAIVVVVGVVLPWAAVAGAVWLVARWVARRVRPRRAAPPAEQEDHAAPAPAASAR